MSLCPAQPVIYMNDTQSAALASMRPLLEASGRPVMGVSDPDLFCRDQTSQRRMRECDALILDLDGGEAPLYRLVNFMMGKRTRPKIFLMVGDNAPLGDQDSFEQSRLHVLPQHTSPRQLLAMLEADG